LNRHRRHHLLRNERYARNAIAGLRLTKPRGCVIAVVSIAPSGIAVTICRVASAVRQNGAWP
jgi:hypothetical protein